MQFALASAPPKIAKECVFANADKNTMKDSQQVTAAMRQAGNPSSVDSLRIREMGVFKRTIPGKSPARRIAAERYSPFKKTELNIITLKNNQKIIVCKTQFEYDLTEK